MDAFFFKLTLARVERRETSKKPFVLKKIIMDPVPSLFFFGNSFVVVAGHCLPNCTKHTKGEKKYRQTTHTPKRFVSTNVFEHLKKTTIGLC